MFSLWNLYILLPLYLPLCFHVIAFTGENVKQKQQPDSDTALQHLTELPQKHHILAARNPSSRTENVNFLGLPASLPLLSSEELDRQGVIGEYVDLQDSIEQSNLYPKEKGHAIPSPTDTEDTPSKERTQPVGSSSEGVPLQTSKYQPAEMSTGSTLHFTLTGENQPTFPVLKNENIVTQLPFLLSGSLPSDHNSTTTVSGGPWPGLGRPTPTVATWGWTTGPGIRHRETQEGIGPVRESKDGLTDITEHILHKGAVRIEEDKDELTEDNPPLSKTNGTICKPSNQSWTPTYPEDFTPNESVRPSLPLSPVLFVPLYSDWNSALATWGFAWEAHVYGLGSVFTVFCLISLVCLLGLPLRCPPGSAYFTLLHFFLLAFAGIQAFCLLYDAYNHQDRLLPLSSLLLSNLPFPCLIFAFSLAFLLLSFRSRSHLSLPLANSTSFTALPKPCLLLCMSLLYSGVSLGCVGLLQFFHSLPFVILLFPQGLFVCLTIFLSGSYLIFYCLMQLNTKHIYRLNDNGESGGSPEGMRPASCPFANVEDWGRAAGAGVGASLCLLGCGGLQLYGILHALGLGGVDGYGFQPWPWWGYQVGCRLCEVGVCLGLSIIGSHPIFCHSNSSIKTITRPRPGSWSRLSCSSPSRGLTLPSQGHADSPILSSHDSWSQGKQEKLVVCDVTTKGQSEALPLFSMLDSSGNGLVPKSRQTQITILPLPTPPTPPHKDKNAGESQLSSLDSLELETDTTLDLRPPSPIDLSRSIDQALFSESIFSHSIFGLPGLYHTSSSLSLSSPSQDASDQGPSSVENALYRTSSCGDADQENALSRSMPSQAQSSFTSHCKPTISPEQWDWKESVSGSTQGLCIIPKDTGKLRSHSWATRGQNFAQSSLPRAIPHLSNHRRYRTLSLASQDSHGSGQLAETKHLSESKQLEWDMAVQAEFVNVCRQIDTLSVCSDTIEL
ncbi:hypothetical protein PBY51_011995 [Eleginops maclovinus]|uniref:Proline-rich transmembrane protein 3/4 domain-containing protein n=2 Tax=Eleginops maclovinus TaxID=56733 RepID=A0AAN7XVA8_ELEMC|nr:hypothetical protein PBY51_011995 [Eleginops maclovinus]